MKRTELILLLLCISGYILHLLGLAYADSILIISISALSLIYMYFSFALFNGIRFRDIFRSSKYKEVNTKDIVKVIPLGFILSVSLIAILFEVMTWPGARFMLLLGTYGSIILAAIGLFLYFRDKNETVKKGLIRLGLIGVITCMLWFTKKDVRLNIGEVEDQLTSFTIRNNEDRGIASLTIEFTEMANSETVLLVDTATVVFDGIAHDKVGPNSESQMIYETQTDCKFVYPTILSVELND
ncbi:MAG: hypothetical protein CMP59_06885 [Flavobacteriales bacterium]|nr:hypothetical protein [Flavobacteriales bacterium]|tara:strand:+ start:328 stop:1050 length:723 start_codon:yes stop_codon:yes gene_type:complete